MTITAVGNAANGNGFFQGQDIPSTGVGSGIIYDPITMAPNATIAEVREVMARNQISGVPIVEVPPVRHRQAGRMTPADVVGVRLALGSEVVEPHLRLPVVVRQRGLGRVRAGKRAAGPLHVTPPPHKPNIRGVIEPHCRGHRAAQEPAPPAIQLKPLI